jgi:imidazoleglycerol phosphate synthase cyclase subunit
MDVYPRLVPALLLSDGRLVKTERFADPVYVGDPVNVLSIFNDFEVDEIMLLDISAARSRTPSDLALLGRLATECFIPLAYGGGVNSSEQARAIVKAGFEKIALNSLLIEDPAEVRSIVAALGSQAVVGSVDVRQTALGYEVFTRGGTVATGLGLEAWARQAAELGVGEVLVTSIDREGTRTGIDLEAVKHVTSVVDVPVIAHGGAGSRRDLVPPVRDVGASAVAAGSLFVLQRGRESVLVNYPDRAEIGRLFADVTDLAGRSNLTAETATDTESAYVEIDESRTCRRCLISADVPGASLDDDRTCHYCRLHDVMEAQYPTGEPGRAELERMAARLKAAGKDKKYDCILGVSGGCDSSYLAHLLVELGLRPLAVHFDNTWNSPIATSNIYAVLDKLGIELETYVVDNHEYDDLYRAFMLAGVKDVEAPTDIGFMGVLYRAAEKHGIKTIIEGHSFRTEGVSPLGWLYMDGGYIKSVHARHGTLPLKTYPNMEFHQFVRWAALSRIERIRPLYHLDYRKDAIKRFLADTYDWQWYGGHHLENRFTAFYHSYLMPTRWGFDFRQIELSALVRSGHLDRNVGAVQLAEPRRPDPELLAMVKKRLQFSDEEFEAVMTAPKRTYLEFDTYKRRFELLRPFFWLLYRAGRVPKSFYVKFCRRTT